VKVTKSTAVTELGLPPIIWRLLWKRGIYTVGELVDYSPAELMELSRVPATGMTAKSHATRILGPGRLTCLTDCLDRHGFALAPDRREEAGR